MIERFWPNSKASIVLVPSGAQGEAVIALAGEWTKMGLLGPALWVLPELVEELVGGPPNIDAVVLGVGRDQEVARVRLDLFEALAQEPLDVVRLVKLRSAVPSRSIDAEQDAIAERVREYVRKSMPMANPSANVTEQATELGHATLICAPTEFQLRQRVDWATGEFGVVVIASPEDRSSPWSGDAFVRENERFVGFTLMHLASVAGLWNGVEQGSFELFRREESGHQSVWISRVFINAVLTESLGRRTAARVLDEAARPDSLLVDPSIGAPPAGTGFIEDALVSAYVDDMVEGALRLDGRALTFRRPGDDHDPAKRRVGIVKQVGRFLAFSGDKLVRMPYWAWRWITSRTSRRLTRALHTDEGAEIVGSRLDEVFDVRDRMLLSDARRIKQSEQEARAQMNAPAGLAHLRTTPRLWARLRELVFGSLDGSADLSDLGFAPVEGNVPIFGRVSDVLALPERPWSAPREQLPDTFPVPVDWYALALSQPRERLEDHVSDATARRVAASESITALTAEIHTLQALVRPPLPAPAQPGSPAPQAAPEPPAGPSAFDILLDETAARLLAAADELQGAQRDFHEAEADEIARTATLQNYDDWAATQDRSFIWRLLVRLGEERRSAERLSATYSEEIDNMSVPAPGALMKLRSRFHRTMLIGWSIAAVIGGLLIWAFSAVGATEAQDGAGQFDSDLWFQVLRIASGVVVAAALILTLVALISYHAGWSRFQRTIDVTRARLVQMGQHSRQARQEATRLASLHRQTVDWLVMLSRAIHRPWHVPPQWMERQSYEVARGAMPFALQIATIQDDEHAASARLRGVMTEQLVVRGWRHQAFESLVREVAAERGAMSGAFGLTALDEDLPHSSNHTRRMLLAALDDETILTRVAGPRLEELVRSAQRNELHGGKPRVRPVGANPLSALLKANDPFDENTGDTPWDDFLLGSLAGRHDPVTPLSATVLTELDISDRHHERVSSYVVLPRRLESRLEFRPGTQLTKVPFNDAGTAPVDIVWRVDIAGPVPKSAIHLWDTSHASQDGPPLGAPPLGGPARQTGPADSGV